MSQPV